MDKVDEATRKYLKQETGHLLPGLFDDVALLCLARLPLSFLGVARTVCRFWKQALQPGNIRDLRLHAGMKSELVFLFVSKRAPNERCLLVLDPHLFDISAIPCPDCVLNREVFEMISGVGGEVLWMGRDTLLGSPLPQLFVLDYLRRRWRSLPSMARLTGGNAAFVWAKIGGVAYFAGGWRDGSVTTEAECLDLSSKRWSSLPDRQFLRVYGKAVAMDGRFLVFHGLPYSNPAEQWHPDLGQWQIVEDVWAKGLKTKRVKIAMLDEGHLCAINHEHAIVKFEPLTKSWVNLGGVLANAVPRTLLGVGSQLWAFLFENLDMIQNPKYDRFLGIYVAELAQSPICWQRLPFCIEGLPEIISTICFKL